MKRRGIIAILAGVAGAFGAKAQTSLRLSGGTDAVSNSRPAALGLSLDGYAEDDVVIRVSYKGRHVELTSKEVWEALNA